MCIYIYTYIYAYAYAYAYAYVYVYVYVYYIGLISLVVVRLAKHLPSEMHLYFFQIWKIHRTSMGNDLLFGNQRWEWPIPTL